MELALYDRRGGYYASSAPRLGPAGDFVTASDSGRAFGRAIATQLAEIDREVGPLDPFDVVEWGAGRGHLARDVLDSLPSVAAGLAGRLRLRMVDRSAALRRSAAELVPEAESLAPEQLGRGLCGALIAVELFDAIPVHRVRRVAGELVEIMVGRDSGGGLIEIEAPASDELRAMAERYGAASVDGFEAELAPGASALLESMAAAFERGVFVLVDYGERADRLYAEQNAAGTLLAYHRHGTNQDYLERVGEQDLTAHVNFSALEDRARELGLSVLGFTTQDRFLIGNGLLEAFEQTGSAEDLAAARVKQRLQAMALIHPGSMGRRFKVLLLAKGCTPRLTSLDDPFAR